jgi:uncharacterized protein YkwD
MKKLPIPCLLAGAALILSSCASGPSTAGRNEPAATPAPGAFGATEESLLAALNASRKQAGLKPLAQSARLTNLARAESDKGAATAQFPPAGNTSAIQMASGFNSIGKLQGTLKDRGASTGASFVDYWKKDAAETLGGSWSHYGLGISKSADGRLFTVLLLGGSGAGMNGGSALMTPAVSPGGL